VPARCLIVDDASPAREELRHLLGGFDDIVVVGEATTAEEAQVLIGSVDYDLVLLDIRMPGMGGLEFARSMAELASRPAVVFTTAYADHAVEAFDLGAADYLVKPFDAQRLRRAVDRALQRRADRAEPQHEELPTSEPQAPNGGGDPVARIPVHKGGRILLVEETRIVFAEAARGYAYLKLITPNVGQVQLTDDRLLTSYNLHDLEERLSAVFVRTHRSFLVNLRHVREVVPQVGGTLSLVMADRDRSQVPVARREASDLRRRLGV
jgi:DNA-binding LytR/AlgR family response regulator